MRRSRFIAAAAIAGWLPLAIAAFAADDPHHPGGAGPAAEATQAPPAPRNGAAQAGMTGATGQQGMMGMMQNMMPMMMGMMSNMMPMMGGDPMGMGMIDHVEGRIAFLRAELKITDQQAPAWNAFADALRANAKKLGAARGMMMKMAAPRTAATTLTQRLDAQERWFAARLEGTRAIKAAFTKLYDGFSLDQKKSAEELLAPNMGVAMGMMGA